MSSKYTAYGSDFLSYTIDNEKGKIAFFGIESGGRDRDKHASYNLMLPAYGGMFGAFKKSLPVRSEITDDRAFFENAGGSSASYNMVDTHTLKIELNKVNKSDIFSTRFSIKTAPPTIWTKKQPKHLKSTNPLTIYKSKYTLPLIVHFPDFGRIEITASSDDIFCVEELQMSRDFTGLDLGYKNHSYNHNRIHGLHYGSSFLTFKSIKPLDSTTLTFKVLDECFPAFPGQDDPKYNGLKRNWLNAFALNRELFDMGDNIYFHGTAHLAIHMKADMLQVMNDDLEQFKIIRRTYERQIERSFKQSQAQNGEVSVCCFNKEKKKSDSCASDSTPGAIIGLTGIASWNLPFCILASAWEILRFSGINSGFFMIFLTSGAVPFAYDAKKSRSWSMPIVLSTLSS